jgi:cytochrome P450
LSVSVASLQERWEAQLGGPPLPAVDFRELLRDLQAAGPVHRFGTAVLVTRYRDVEAVTRDSVRYGSAPQHGSFERERRSLLSTQDRRAYDELIAFRSLLMAQTDGSDHRRLRAAAHRAFTPRRVAELGTAVQSYMDELLTPIVARGGGEVLDVAYRLPLMVIGDLLNVPPQDRELMHDWTTSFVRASGRRDPEAVRAALTAVHNFTSYIESSSKSWRRHREPSQLTDVLIAAEEEDRLSAVELAAMFVQLIVAGHETTTTLIAAGVHELLLDPDQWSRLCDDPDRLAPGATEELLRYITPLPWRTRTALEDVEIAGVPVAAGTTVFAMIAAANRDPEIFKDPDTLDIERGNAARHLTFGLGPHFCLGASLTRLEGSVAFRTLAGRFPQLSLASDSVEWTERRRPRSVPVWLAGAAC